MPEFYRVGRIVNTQGLKGELRILATTDFPDARFQAGQRLYIQTKQGPVAVTVKSHRKHKNFELLTFEGYDDINAVEQFKGDDLEVAAADRGTDLSADEYYYNDIIGLTVKDVQTGNPIGTVTDIMDLGPNDVWVVERDGKSDLLLPYLKSVVLKVDLQDKTATVDVPAGLDDED
ncbi:16S rRNA processing protein RimM [Lactobacillus selangorensis]|uniref:Ribosome maturation factor RimM n=1 Tax=Lactobacillus selangorensis TaxID=81857 RepID=A0A0R2G6L3_9LACO|nr:ribosome maturation factor RimM [Lactobacillus selangorensis]KRN29625.1 16S rRNA processing protein RimM [Lactobacillus selangorensis]KRN33845.1 16S rRNA processing protein RimM [Lactobacillus selangorensis]